MNEKKKNVRCPRCTLSIYGMPQRTQYNIAGSLKKFLTCTHNQKGKSDSTYVQQTPETGKSTITQWEKEKKKVGEGNRRKKNDS